MIHLEKYRKNKETGEEEIVAFSFYKEDVICLYRDQNGVYIVNNQGFMNKVPYKMKDLRELLGL